jgi:hypothetical protein
VPWSPCLREERGRKFSRANFVSSSNNEAVLFGEAGDSFGLVLSVSSHKVRTDPLHLPKPYPAMRFKSEMIVGINTFNP